jgi:hypothetical protein
MSIDTTIFLTTAMAMTTDPPIDILTHRSTDDASSRSTLLASLSNVVFTNVLDCCHPSKSAHLGYLGITSYRPFLITWLFAMMLASRFY